MNSEEYDNPYQGVIDYEYLLYLQDQELDDMEWPTEEEYHE